MVLFLVQRKNFSLLQSAQTVSVQYFFTPPKSCHLRVNVEKHGIARKVTHDNIVLQQKGVLCMLDN